MAMKILAIIVATILLIGYVGAAAVKLKDVALIVVTLVGIVMMLVEMWDTLQSKDD